MPDEPKPTEESAPTAAKSLLFSVLILVAFALLAEVLLAVLGFEPLLHREDPYVGFTSRVPLFVPGVDRGGGETYHTADNKSRFFNHQSFTASKRSGVRRAFCIGGSTTYGRPFDDDTSFCGWLRLLLERLEPSRWEIVNAGGISYASYRAAAVMEELADHEPDLFVIYSGHNEFLERRTYSAILEQPRWIRDADASLRRTRAYSALRGVLERLRDRATDAKRTELPPEVETVLDRSVGLDAYTRDDLLREKVIAHYRFNIERMVEISRNVGADAILVVPASNRSDCTPFKSEHAEETSHSDRERWQEQFQIGRIALREGREREAQRAFLTAVEIDPRRADGLYWLGRAAAAAGDPAAAAAAYDGAREEDVCPLRALAAMSANVREVAAERDVALVDFPALLREAASREGSGDPFGAAYFLDHVHPTIAAHGLVAVGIVEAMIARQLLDATLEPDVVSAAGSAVFGSVDTHEHGKSLRNLAKVLSWAGKTEDAARAARLALSYLDADAECEFILGSWASEQRRWREAVDHYQQALEIEGDYVKAINNLGIALVRSGEPERALTAYEEVLRLQPDHPSARYNLANALSRLGRIDAAVAQYREVLRTNPGDGDAHYNLARLYERRGDGALADEHYRAAADHEDPQGRPEPGV